MDTLHNIAVIGAGTAGRAFALRCARAGFRVALEDVMPEKLRRAQDEYGAVLGEAAAGGSVRYAVTVEDAVHDADLAIDFVPDELESKLEIFSLLDRMSPPRTVLCTPTDTLSITDLASCTYRSERCVGLRGDLLQGPIQIVRSKYLSCDVEIAVLSMLRTLGVRVNLVADTEPMLWKNLRASSEPVQDA